MFRVLGDNAVMYLDRTGSGNETAAHLKINPRLTIMFCAVAGPPLIMRLFRQGRVIRRNSAEFASLLAEHYEGHAPLGARQMIMLDFDLVQTSCGYGVPLSSTNISARRWMLELRRKASPVFPLVYSANSALFLTPEELFMDRSTSGWINGLIGVVIFSGSLPATRIAVQAFDPLFLTVVRAVIAGVLGLGLLLAFKQPRPKRQDLFSLMIVAIGVVVGFPLLTALALQHITSAHSIVFIGLLPLSTAIFGVLRGGERPKLAFWIFSILGSLLVAGFAASQGINVSPLGNTLMLAAIIVCGLGYAEGAKLSRAFGGWQVISWALVISLPFTAILTTINWPSTFSDITAPAWLSLAYVSLFSMLIGFVFWYRGLAQGGIAAVGQLQLLQPFFGLALAWTLLREPVTPAMLLVTVAVIACVAGARKFGQ